MNTRRTVLMVIVSIVALGCSTVWADEDAAYTSSDMPEAVLKAFEATHPDVTPTGYDVETEDDTKQFEIETKNGKYEFDYIYLEDGTLLQTEEQIGTKMLPDAVVKAARDAHPNCELDEAEKITRGSTIEYEVVVEVGEDNEFELLIASDGKVLKSQALEDEDEDEDDDDDDDSDDKDEKKDDD